MQVLNRLLNVRAETASAMASANVVLPTWRMPLIRTTLFIALHPPFDAVLPATVQPLARQWSAVADVEPLRTGVEDALHALQDHKLVRQVVQEEGVVGPRGEKGAAHDAAAQDVADDGVAVGEQHGYRAGAVAGRGQQLGVHHQRTMMMDSPTVTRIAVDAPLKGKASVAPGYKNAALAQSTRLMPRKLAAMTADRLMTMGSSE